jgi:hypothetical protein
MRRILFVLALLTALVPTTGNPVSAQVAPLAPFSGYSTGTAVHAGALENGPTRLVDSEIAFSGANVNSSGLGVALTNEMAQAYQAAAKAGDKSAGRGSGLEIGLATTVPNVTNANQINPGSTVQMFAPVSTPLTKKEFIPVALDPIVNATTLRGEAQAIYSDSVCVLGQPISSGLGYAANANLINAPTSLLATNTVANAVNQSKSFTYLIPNGDGTYGLVTESHQILAPLSLLGVAGLPLVTIEFAGEWVLRSTATGKAGGSKVEYAPSGAETSTTKVITVKAAGTEVASLTTQQLLGQKGLVVDIPLVGQIVIGEDPRAIGNLDANSSPELAANGTVAGGAVDVVRITTLPLVAALGINVADLRVGHMEAKATVPVGGIQCGIPVTKTGNPTTVTAGDAQTVTYTITVPSDPEAFKAIACDLVNLKVVDVVSADNPGVKFELLSASAPGKITNGNTVTWDLGTYKPGDPAKVLTVTMDVPADSAAGQITDVATATAVLGNCTGNASANATSLTGLAKLNSAALSGSANLVVPGTTVLAGQAVGPTPIGGVQTGAGGTSQGSGRMLPIGMALGSIALVGTLVARRRQHN